MLPAILVLVLLAASAVLLGTLAALIARLARAMEQMSGRLERHELRERRAAERLVDAASKGIPVRTDQPLPRTAPYDFRYLGHNGVPRPGTGPAATPAARP